MNNDLLYQLSLCQVPYIGPVHAKILISSFPSVQAIFEARQHALEKIDGIGPARARSIKTFSNFDRAEKEIAFIKRYGIRPLFLKNPEYPQRLLNCEDPPTVLFYKGNADLNSSKIVAIVGTRNSTEYGKNTTEKLIRELAGFGILIVSGLAYGIDSIAHKSAIRYGLPTIGVVGHGLDTMYPQQNAVLAKEMLKNGGLLSEFPSNTNPDKHNFPSRNRIVAGISDATIIIESGVRGGSIITAELANGYHRDVFALPGRNIDNKSIGCNDLIRTNKAAMLGKTEHFIEAMGWEHKKKQGLALQKNLFTGLSEEEKKIVDMLRQKELLTIDELIRSEERDSGSIAAVMLNLELQGLVQRMPGKQYRLKD